MKNIIIILTVLLFSCTKEKPEPAIVPDYNYKQSSWGDSMAKVMTSETLPLYYADADRCEYRTGNVSVNYYFSNDSLQTVAEVYYNTTYYAAAFADKLAALIAKYGPATRRDSTTYTWIDARSDTGIRLALILNRNVAFTTHYGNRESINVRIYQNFIF